MIKKFKYISFVIICIIQTNVSIVSAAPVEGITVLLNDEPIVYDENYGYPFIDENKRTQVPFRLTLEKFGAIVTWNEETKTAIAVKDDVLVEVPIGKDYIVRNGEVVINDTTSTIVGGRTYLPIRIVMEAFNCKVEWDATDKEVQIDYRVDILPAKQIPSKYDLREYGRVTPVKNQGDIGTCWAFAAIGALESNLLPAESWDFSEDHLSLLHGYNITQNDGGDLYMALGYFASWKGPVLEKDDVYGDGVANEEAVIQKHLQEAMILPEKDYRAIKSAIILNGGVISSMHIETDLELLDKYFSSDMSSYYYNEYDGYNHDIVIIGWDDNYPKENFTIKPKSDGAFLVKSSYGLEFGKNGYFYISYEDTYIGRHNSVYSRVENTNNYKNIYQADLLGLVGKYGYKSDTAYFANVYEIKNSEELLKAIAFYATDEDVKYEIYFVNNFSTKNDLRNREFIDSGILNYKGYYTIDLEEPILVSDRFAVIIKATAPHNEKPIPLEFQGELQGLESVIIDDGEGYISSDGRYWDDTENLLEGNVSLKVFTDNVE